MGRSKRRVWKSKKVCDGDEVGVERGNNECTVLGRG